MRDYGKVHSSFWSSQTIRDLSEDGRTLSLYLMTSPHSTIAGVFRLPDGYVCEDLGWSSERVCEGFAELLANGFCNRCETTKWVWIYKHLKWNQPENPNQRKAAAKCADQVPDECSWKARFYEVSGEMLGMKTPQKENPSETVTEPFRNQKQEQEQEQKQEKGEAAAPVPGDAGDRPPDPSPKQSRGTRIPDDWRLTPELRSEADRVRSEGKLPPINVDAEASSFRDYWIAKPGKDGLKTDWLATWRNWIRKSRTPTNGSGVPERRPSFLGANELY